MSRESESTERTNASLGATSRAVASDARQRPTRWWTRTRVIWALIMLSLTPAVVVSQFRHHWEQRVPAAARIATYVVSGLLIAVACGLIVKAPDDPRSPEE